MGHVYHQNLGHAIFHVASVSMRDADVERVMAYIAGIAINLGVMKPIVGGIENHVHLLGDFPMTQTVPDVMRRLKSSSSGWIKGLHRHYHAFAWQQGYAYFSVSASRHHQLADYIRTQREHHMVMSAEEEYQRLVAKHSQID